MMSSVVYIFLFGISGYCSAAGLQNVTAEEKLKYNTTKASAPQVYTTTVPHTESVKDSYTPKVYTTTVPHTESVKDSYTLKESHDVPPGIADRGIRHRGNVMTVLRSESGFTHGNLKTSKENPTFKKPHVDEVTVLPRTAKGKSLSSPGERTGVGFAVTLPVATALIIVVALIGFWVYRRKRIQPTRHEEILMVPLRKGLNGKGNGDILTEEDETKTMTMPKPRPIRLHDLETVIGDEKTEPTPFKEEYLNIPRNQQANWSCATHESVQQKNRFKNILPYNHSRVVLALENDSLGSDYINASYILGYNGKKEFIAAQGPTKLTVNDFWRMVWEQKSALIVMLTNLFEDGKIKCSQYWPEEGTEEYGKHRVTLIQMKQLPDFTIRTLKITSGNMSREVLQYHFTNWPDHGVPEHATGLLNFRRKVRKEITNYQEAGPVIAHCSAGVGRTGALIAIDYLIQQAEAEQQIDVSTCVGLMRKNRVNMVQTVEQYSFVYTALLESIWVGETLIPCAEFTQMYDSLLCPDPYSSSSKLEEQFKLLESMKPKEKEGNFSTALNPSNILKNRSLGILPGNNKNPLLMTRVDDRTSYINAVFVDGRNHFGKFIATQMPLADTVVDLWRMVFDYKCSSIIMLNRESSGEQVTGGYWPKMDRPQTYGPLTVTLENETQEDFCLMRNILVTYQKAKKNESIKVRQFCLRGTIANDRPAGDLFCLHDEVERWQTTSNRPGPIVVHCLDGAQETGVYLALSNLVDMMTMEQELDIFQVVQNIRKDRPHFITSLMQFRYLYEAVKQFMDMNNTVSH